MGMKSITQLQKLDTHLDPQDDYYRPFELTVLQDLFAFSEINHSVRDYMPNNTTNFSPFFARGNLLGKKREEMSSSKTNLSKKNPSVAGNSTSSSTSTEEVSEDEDELPTEDIPDKTINSNSSGYISFQSLLPASNVVSVPEPSASDLQLYRSMASLSKLSGPPMFSRKVSLTALPHPLGRSIDANAPCPIPVHDYEQVLLKPISK